MEGSLKSAFPHPLRKHAWLPLVLGLLASWTSHLAYSAPVIRLQVNLLGQPCMMSGPFDPNTLKTTHAIGPAQIYPVLSTANLSDSIREARASLNKIRNFRNLLPLFDGYQKRLILRLQAQLEFLNGLESVRKTHQTQLFFDSIKNFVKPNKLKTLRSQIKILESASRPSSAEYRKTEEELFSSFNEAIEADPEPEFHRILKQLQIEYICSFDEIHGPSSNAETD